MENSENVIADLKELLRVANDGKEGYESAEQATESPELKAIFSRFMGERIVYADELREHIARHGGEADNESGGILGGLHRTWLTIKQAFSSNDDEAILEAITTGEQAAIDKYDECIENYDRHADHLGLLTGHREGIKAALVEIEMLLEQYDQDEETEVQNDQSAASGFVAGSSFGANDQASAPGNYSQVSEAEQMGDEGLTGREPRNAGSAISDASEFGDETDELDTDDDNDEETGAEEEFDDDYIVTEETGNGEFDADGISVEEDDDDEDSSDSDYAKSNGSADFPGREKSDDAFPGQAG